MRIRSLDLAAVVLVCASAMLAALLELLLVPLYAGSTLVPATVLFAIVGNVALPRLAHSVVPSTAALVGPFASWLLVVVVVGLFPRPEGDVILPGGGAGVQWAGYGVLLGGSVAGTVTAVMLAGPRPRGAAVAARSRD